MAAEVALVGGDPIAFLEIKDPFISILYQAVVLRAKELRAKERALLALEIRNQIAEMMKG